MLPVRLRELIKGDQPVPVLVEGLTDSGHALLCAPRLERPLLALRVLSGLGVRQRSARWLSGPLRGEVLHVPSPQTRLLRRASRLGLTDGGAADVLGKALTRGQRLAFAPYDYRAYPRRYWRLKAKRPRLFSG